MTPRKYLMISALSKQMNEVKEQTKKEVSKFDSIKHPVMWACDDKTEYESRGYYGATKFIGYIPKQRIPEDIAKEVFDFYKELQVMKADEIYGAVLKKLISEAKIGGEN
jgi:phage terminase large subunit